MECEIYIEEVVFQNTVYNKHNDNKLKSKIKLHLVNISVVVLNKGLD